MVHYPDEAEIPATAQPPASAPRRALGWLDAAHDFRQGDCPRAAVRRLEEAVRTPVARTRSWFQCPLCPLTGMGPTVYRATDGEELLLGNATVQIPGEDGRDWRAPSLVPHYISEHDYLPPDPFLADVAGTAGRDGP